MRIDNTPLDLKVECMFAQSHDAMSDMDRYLVVTFFFGSNDADSE